MNISSQRSKILVGRTHSEHAESNSATHEGKLVSNRMTDTDRVIEPAKNPPLQIAASILSADLARIGEEVAAVLDAGADLIHFDVMDNHYVPNLTFGPGLCAALRNYGIKAPIEVHLMTRPVDELIVKFAQAGATRILFHPEASDHIDRSLSLIHQNGCEAGLALNPATSLNCLEYLWEKLELVLLMSVNPGFGGQTFIPAMLPKITQLHHWLNRLNLAHQPIIEVDGGVKADNSQVLYQAGAAILVAGSAIFDHPANYASAIRDLRIGQILN